MKNLRNIKITVSYDGTAYCGWQTQKSGQSIQQKIEQALNELTGENIKIIGSGRTDAGVHAIGQVANFLTASSIPAKNFAKALNTKLPNDIRVGESQEVESDFNARKCAKKKTYIYKFYYGESENALLYRYATYIKEKPDMAKFKLAGKLMEGEKDFKCFMASGSSVKSTVRTVYSVEVKESDNLVEVAVCGNGFLYNMVRTMVGTMLKFAYGKIGEKDVEKMFNNGDRKIVGKTMEAKGLTLKSVDYN